MQFCQLVYNIADFLWHSVILQFPKRRLYNKHYYKNKMRKQKFEQLVTVFGGGGYIGSLLTRLLLDQGYGVRVFDNFLFGDDGVKDLKHSNLEIINGDVGNVYQVTSALKNTNIVIFLSELSGKRFEHQTKNDSLFRDSNYIAPSMVLYASKEYGAERFIYASSDCVYGGMTGLVYETAIPEPVSLYARLKLRMEESVIRAKSRIFHPTILRIANCFGYSPRMRFDLLPNTVLRDAIYRKQVSIDSENTCRAFVHVDDVSRAIATCVRAHVNLVSGEIFNVGANNQNLTRRMVVNAVKKIHNDFEVKIIKQQPDLYDYKLSCKKIEKLLDFTPTWTIEEGLADLKQHLTSGDIKDPYNDKYHNLPPLS